MAHSLSTQVEAPRRRRRLRALTLGLTVLTVTQAVLAAGVYRWVDEQGKVHYGDRPPSQADSSPVKIEAAPTPAPEDAHRRAKTQRLLEAIESERARDQADAVRAEAEQARKTRNCRAAREHVTIYERANSVSRRGPDGQRLYLSDEERAQALSRARALVDYWCK